jgi:hypothetical protein
VSEAQVQRGCIELLRAEGWRVFETHGHEAHKGHGEAGQPDLVAIKRTPIVYDAWPRWTQVLFVEVKVPGGRVSAAQKAWHAAAEADNFSVLVVSEVLDLRRYLKGERA